MPTMKAASADPNEGVVSAAGYGFSVATLLASALIWLVDTKTLALALDVVAILSIFYLLLQFMVSIIRNVGRRSWQSSITFCVSSSVALISTFGNFYFWFGLKVPEGDTLSAFECIYFSVITWTTVGYGEIVPLGYSRLVVAAEALTGYLVMALVIAVLSAMIQGGKDRKLQLILRELDKELKARRGDKTPLS